MHESTPEPEPVSGIEPTHEPFAEIEPTHEPIAEIEPTHEPIAEPEPEPVLEISYPDPAVDAPPGLSVEAFKDIKPVAFGGVVVEENEPPAPEPRPEPVVENAEPVVEMEPEPEPAFEPISYPDPEPAHEPEAEPAIAAAVVEPVVTEDPKPKKRGFRLPNPELKLPSFGKKKSAAATTTEPKAPKAKGGLKLPQVTLPANLQGPLSDIEQKIVLGSVVAIVAAAAFGYTTAPSEDAGATAPTPASAAASR